ncbi:hypothetical protein [Virgibacillus salarius]|uniref:hypothetical protein n=1 Tax=Virgibacillus salarius TaxID=447199 RepID=UPI001FEAE3E2|nr:hypothetical protein [Virgibacillus salarius]
MQHLENHNVYQLIEGEQRIAIIRLILQGSDSGLADGPTASLDSDNEKIILQYLKQLNQKGKTIIVVTHHPAILHYFSRVISLSDSVLMFRM